VQSESLREFNMPANFLTHTQLVRLTEHKYSSSGETLLDPFMQKFWQWSVTKFPKWVAPNLMTVVGLIVNALTTFILIYHSPDARQVVSVTLSLRVVRSEALPTHHLFVFVPMQVPPWTMILFAFGLFIYQTLDACDGKQARRTQSSSPLGELFDHGCDSLSTGTSRDRFSFSD
jgi:choline/ethanolamine phosphotransferase